MGLRERLGSLFGGRPASPEGSGSRQGSLNAEVHGAEFRKGDIIGGIYEVLGVLGMGGFSVVYLVHSRETEHAYALKTIRNQLLEDQETREQFRREAKVWVDLEHHPYIVWAHFIEELSGRLFIGMEYIQPTQEGLNSLEGYLAKRPPDFSQSLRWAIQFCHGMEYARSRGIRSHRDIKPANIMITQEGMVKITDFGFARAIDRSRHLGALGGRKRLTHTLAGFGTPNYMPPEQFLNAETCDERSDIYSFGVVLYQMATGGKLPFVPSRHPTGLRGHRPSVWRDMHRLHTTAPPPKANSLLNPIIQRCLAKEQSGRFQSFRALRSDLEVLLHRETGEIVVPVATRELAAWELYNKAFSLASLGHLEDAIKHYDRVLELEPRNSDAWNNRGVCCKKLGKLDEALECYEKAIRGERLNASAWSNKGNVLQSLGRHTEALVSLNKAVEIDSENESAWLNKALVEDRLGLRNEALASFKTFVGLNPTSYAEHLAYVRKRIAELTAR